MRTLLIRFSALGDVAMLAPIVKEAAEAAPDDTFTVLSMPFCAPLFENLADNVHFLGKDIRNDYKGIYGLYRLFRELHALKFDRVVDEHDVLRTKVLRVFFRMHGYQVSKIDKHRALRRQLTAPEGKKQLVQLPTSFQNYRTALTGTPGSSVTFTFDKDSATEETAGSAHNGASHRMRVGIAPFAAHQGKIYPLEKMERVIELLMERHCEVVLFGGGGKEIETMQKWVDRFTNADHDNEITLARTLIKERGGEVGLRSELLLMKDLDVMVSMDSANMHLASLVGCRVVSIWGATHPCAGFLGWGQQLSDCVQKDMPCRPCSIYGNKPCQHGDYPCLGSITPEEVILRIKK